MWPKVAEFEAALAETLAVRHVIAVANGTAALHLALLALVCGPDDEIIDGSRVWVRDRPPSDGVTPPHSEAQNADACLDRVRPQDVTPPPVRTEGRQVWYRVAVLRGAKRKWLRVES